MIAKYYKSFKTELLPVSFKNCQILKKYITGGYQAVL